MRIWVYSNLLLLKLFLNYKILGIAIKCYAGVEGSGSGIDLDFQMGKQECQSTSTQCYKVIMDNSKGNRSISHFYFFP